MNPFTNIRVNNIICKVEHCRWIGRAVNEDTISHVVCNCVVGKAKVAGHVYKTDTISHVVCNCVVGKAKVAGHVYKTDTIESCSRNRGVVKCSSTDARSKYTVSSSGSIDVNPTNDVVVSQQNDFVSTSVRDRRRHGTWSGQFNQSTIDVLNELSATT